MKGVFQPPAARRVRTNRSPLRRGAGRWTLGFLVLAAVLVLAGTAGIMFGPVQVSLEQIRVALEEGFLGQVHSPASTIIFDLRLPRVLMGMLVGAALGVSGAAYQGLFRNPLADPYLMGVASGAAFGATVGLVLTGTLANSALQWVSQNPSGLVNLFAFAGAGAAVALALLLAGGAARTQDLILAGVVVGAILTGLTTYLMLQSQDRVLAVFSYTLGNLSFAGWAGVRALGLYLVLTLPPLWLMARVLNAMQLGEPVARSLGLPLGALKLAIIAAATLVTAAAVAQAGVIGFVGLIAPHAVRRLFGGDYRVLIPASALFGASLLVTADLLARMLISPSELPVGVVTTLLGGPFFLYLLWRKRAGG